MTTYSLARQRKKSRIGAMPAPDTRLLDRYRLVDRVGDGAGSSVWHATDERLKRPVSVRLLPLTDHRAEELRDRAQAAARVFDRRAVPILDVVEDRSSGFLVIISEWVDAATLSEFLIARGDLAMPPVEAATLTLEVTRYLSAVRSEGQAHGNLRPDSVMIGADGEVRVRGLGVDLALYGIYPQTSPELADVHGAGAVLYATLTNRWPEPESADGLPGVPMVEHHAPRPSRVVADVPEALDQICARALLTTPTPKGQEPFDNVDEIAEELATVVTLPGTKRRPVRAGRTVLRIGSVVLFTAAAVGLAALGVSLMLGLGSGPLLVPRPQVSSAAPSAKPTAATITPTVEKSLAILSAKDVDPYGNNNENSVDAPLAFDGDPATAWHTVVYRRPDMSGKQGVGIMFDLGSIREISAVQLNLVGAGTDVTVGASDDPTVAPEKFEVLAQATAAGSELRLRLPKPIRTQYVLVWFTQLPASDSGGYQGGVSEIKILG